MRSTALRARLHQRTSTTATPAPEGDVAALPGKRTFPLEGRGQLAAHPSRTVQARPDVIGLKSPASRLVYSAMPAGGPPCLESAPTESTLNMRASDATAIRSFC